LETLDSLFQRNVIIVLAVAGAIIATVGSYLQRSASRLPQKAARRVTQCGYTLAWLSVIFFIIAGFRSDL
jgi:hypothetical protein